MDPGCLDERRLGCPSRQDERKNCESEIGPGCHASSPCPTLLPGIRVAIVPRAMEPNRIQLQLVRRLVLGRQVLRIKPCRLENKLDPLWHALSGDTIVVFSFQQGPIPAPCFQAAASCPVFLCGSGDGADAGALTDTAIRRGGERGLLTSFCQAEFGARTALRCSALLCSALTSHPPLAGSPGQSHTLTMPSRGTAASIGPSHEASFSSFVSFSLEARPWHKII
jgi:hypothetical protein